MRTSYCDGLSVDYNPSDSTIDDPRRTCTTQSSAIVGDCSDLEGLYTPSPTLATTETIQPAHQQTMHFSVALGTVPHSYPLSHVSRSSSSSQSMWPTPSTDTCDDFEDYAYHASPASAGFGHPAAVSVSSRSSADSPRSWSSSDAQQFLYPQTMWRNQDHSSPYNLQTTTTLPADNSFQQHVIASPYADASFLNSSIDPAPMVIDAPNMTPEHVDSIRSNRSASPLPPEELSNNGFAYGDGDNGAPPSGQGGNSSDRDDANKIDVPYARLIFKAFMSRENHAMTLQELYQWFRENTDKAKADSKGWQNSIRHNLSMNAVSHSRNIHPACSPSTPSQAISFLMTTNYANLWKGVCEA
jgi:hypothetical protein